MERFKRQSDLALITGWYAARFERENRLQPPAYYLKEAVPSDPALAEAEAAAETTRWALSHGLTVEDVGDEG